MSLTDKLKAMEPEPVGGFSGFVDREEYEQMRDIAVILSEALELIMRDMPSKAKEKFDKNEVTYFCKDAGAEVLDHRFEHAITCREALAAAEKVLGE